ncbi:MAG: DedA family protein [Deltaproteobacteria bacterium]|nr:DedA family protein [Deltaproteobacteria bacterium]
MGLVIFALSACVEYVFPPFPGDTVTLFAGFLISAKGWSFLLVFGSVLAGSALGSMAGFWLGRWLKERRERRPPRHPKATEALDKLVERFRRHGEVLIVMNRFVPGLRAVFFVAAGISGMRGRWVLAWATVSAAIWNLMLIAVGSSVGANLDTIRGFFSTYSRLAWMLIAVVLAAWIIRWTYRRARSRARRRTGENPTGH